MLSARYIFGYITLLCLGVALATSEKQIKLEDIEKDTLKAAQKVKYEKQLQQQQQQQYQQATLQFNPQTYSQQSIAYQMPASQSQFLIPQQYFSQPLFSGYAPLSSNSLGVNYSPSTQTFQTYLSPQYSSVPSVSSFHSNPTIAAASQNQPFVMAFTTPLTAISQQPYYQGIQYYPSQSSQASQYIYTTQLADQTSSAQLPASFIYPSAQQYLTYQPTTSSKAATSYSQFVSTAPQTFPIQSYQAQQEYTSLYSPQTYSSNSVYRSGASVGSSSSSSSSSSSTETPATFVMVKAPQNLVASAGQNQQYAQAHSTTLSPLQFKYLNSPQYLAQNYNTIQSSQLFQKGSFSSGVKSTVAPPTKALVGSSYSGSTGNSASFLPNNFSSSSSSVSSFVPFRNVPSKNFAV